MHWADAEFQSFRNDDNINSYLVDIKSLEKVLSSVPTRDCFSVWPDKTSKENIFY